MKRLVTGLAAILVALSLSAHGSDGWVVSDAILARVDDEVITLNEVGAERSILRWSGETDMKTQKEIVGDLVKRRLLVAEAAKLRIIVPEDEIAADVAVLSGAGGSPKAFWELMGSVGMTKADLKRRALELGMVSRYLGFRREAAFVSEADVREFFRANIDVFGGKPLAVARDEVREHLASKKYRAELSQWIDRQIEMGRVRLQDLPETKN